MRALLLLSVLLLAPLAGCLGGQADAQVLATSYPLLFLTESIAGEDVSVGLALPANAEPHDWAPAARDIARLDRARLVIAQGAGLDAWLAGVEEALGNDAPRIVYTGEDIHDPQRPWLVADDHGHGAHHDDDHDADNQTTNTTTPPDNGTSNNPHSPSPSPDDHDDHDDHDDGDHAHDDPHTWLDPVRFAYQAFLVRDALAAAWPEHTAAFDARLHDLQSTLADLDRDHLSAFADCRTRTFVTLHNAFGLFAERYELNAVAILGLDPESEASPQAVQRAVDTVRTHDLKVVFAESTPPDRLIQNVAQETGTTIQTLSTLETRTPAERSAGLSYFDLMRRNLERLAAGMECT